MLKRYSGKIIFGDETRCAGDQDIPNGSVHIGGVDIVYDLSGAFASGSKVTVGVADERFQGPFEVETGWGYSEFTPMESDLLLAGEYNILKILGERFAEGDNVTIWIADEPVNLLEN